MSIMDDLNEIVKAMNKDLTIRRKMLTDKEQLIEIYEQLVGDDGINRYTHKEIIKYINQLKDIEENEDVSSNI